MLLGVCDAAAAKVGPPVRGAEPVWSCVEALKAAGSGDFAAGMAREGALFATVSAAAVGAFIRREGWCGEVSPPCVGRRCGWLLRGSQKR